MRQFNEDTLTDEVVARLKKTKDPRFTRDHDQRGEAPARLRARGASHRGGMVRGHQVPHRGRPEVRRQAPGVHPALRRARAVDDGGGAQPQDRARRDRGHGARAVLRARREGVRLRRRPARRRDDEGRGRLGQRPGAGGGRQAGARRRARHLAGQGRRHLRPADRGRVRAARPRQGERQGRVRVRELQAEVLQHPDGRPGRRPGARHQQQPHAPGAHARHRLGARLPAGDHARLRRGRSVPRRRRGVRGEELAHRQVQEGERRRRGEEASACSNPFLKLDLGLPPLARQGRGEEGAQEDRRRATRSHDLARAARR